MKKLVTFIFLLPLLGCIAPKTISKQDTSRSSSQTRSDVIEFKKNNPTDATDLSKINTITSEISEDSRNIAEIKSKQKLVKFTDPTWNDFPISLDLNVVPLRTFFQLLKELTKLNFVVGDEVKGDISLKIKGVSWIETFEMILKEKNLISDVSKSGNFITIHTHEFASTQSESLDKALNSKNKALKSFNGLETKTTAIIKLNYTNPTTLAEQLKNVIKTLDATSASGSSGDSNLRASFVVDARTNSIIVQAAQSDIEWIKSAIINLDKPTRQVMVEVFIVEASDNFEAQLGSRLSYFNSGHNGLLGNTTLTGTGGSPPTTAGVISASKYDGALGNNIPFNSLGGVVFDIARGGVDLRVELQAMQSEGLTKIISNPKLFIIDNESATITDGIEIPYQTVATAGVSSTSFKSASLQLQVKPSIISDGNVYLDLTVNKDEPGIAVAGGAPPISTKQIKTKLLVKDGGIAMIGGINKSTDKASRNGVPFFENLPIVGQLFRSNDNINSKNQLYIFISPKVL
jgi:type IV pilus assembly protein PilQ